jgi:MATE family multidrug resistance protein
MSLTKYPQGSLRELWVLSFPLMLSSLSVMAMLFVDRLMLANYSPEALMAAVSASTTAWAFIFACTVIGSISQVFVAQYNGAGLKEKFGEPVWQMIWFSLVVTLFFVPFGYFGAQLFFPEQPLHSGYFKWMIIFGSSYPLYSALCGFFIGQGKTRLITALALVANFVNAGMDYVLIYGIEGISPSYGVEGAAIATSGSSIFQVIILAALFLNKKNRAEHKTGDYRLKWPMLKQCLKIGIPSGLFCGCEIGGWAAYYWMLGSISAKHLIVGGITQSVVILCYFFSEGINKGAATVAGNLIGAKQYDLVPKVLKNGMKLIGAFFVFLCIGYVLFNNEITELFLHSARQEAGWDHSIDSSLRICLLLSMVYMLFEGIRLLLTGLLTASGDTRFLLIGGTVATWGFLVLPVYALVVRSSGSIEYANLICVGYSALASLIYLLRFYTSSWRERNLIESA